MKRIILFPAFAVLLTSCYSQSGDKKSEFVTYSNGLMYSDGDMKTLRFIVDSLNLRFKTCDLTKKFYSKPQAKVYSVSFQSKTNNLKEIIEDMKNGLGPDKLFEKYKKYAESSDKSMLIIRSENDYYLSGDPLNGYEQKQITEVKNFNDKKVAGKWTYVYEPKGKYWDYYSADCYYFSNDFVSVPIPNEYGKLIQYVDCMIDTSAVLYLTDNADVEGFRKDLKIDGEINSYLNSAMKLKKTGKDDWEFDYISPKKIKFATENLKNDHSFISLIEKTADECMASKNSDEELESLIGEFVSKEKALYLKRCRRVIGGCSMDQSPRLHARSIALLAAEAHSWDIFLRAHLDIMNDRFERASDGSYAWGQRNTYLKELEELNLNVVDLMLGLTLRADNVAGNHYYGTIWRMGRALAESRDKDLFEKKAIAIMKDNSLDEFNRGLVFLLYHTYTWYVEGAGGKQKRDALRNDIKNYPGFIQEAIKEMKEPKEDKG